jgi:hypothetical protein
VKIYENRKKINQNNKNINNNWIICMNKGAHSPDVRGVSLGVFPIQSIKSKVLESDDVSWMKLKGLIQLFACGKNKYLYSLK